MIEPSAEFNHFIKVFIINHSLRFILVTQSAGEANSDTYASLSSQGLKGVEAFTLDYKVAWPTSIVLSRRAITKYQLLSRLLYFSKHVERRVLVSWVGHQSTKVRVVFFFVIRCSFGILPFCFLFCFKQDVRWQLYDAFASCLPFPLTFVFINNVLQELNVRGAMGPAYCLRHRMLHFLQNFVYYMTLEVIGPRGHELEGLLDKAEDLDEVMELHERFLDTCLKECLLASQDLLKILTKIMTTCLLFADQMQRFTLDSVQQGKDVGHASSGRVGTLRQSGAHSHASAAGEQAAQAQRQNRLRESAEFIQKESSHESFTRILNKFGETFDAQVRTNLVFYFVLRDTASDQANSFGLIIVHLINRFFFFTISPHSVERVPRQVVDEQLPPSRAAVEPLCASGLQWILFQPVCFQRVEDVECGGRSFAVRAVLLKCF